MKNYIGKKGIYKIHKIHSLDYTRFWEDVTGYEITITGFEDFEFFVHRGEGFLSESNWRVSEVTTGFAFPDVTEGSTRLEAIKKVTKFLQEKGRDKFLKAMDMASHQT